LESQSKQNRQRLALALLLLRLLARLLLSLLRARAIQPAAFRAASRPD
jgi:hypothetical protein